MLKPVNKVLLLCLILVSSPFAYAQQLINNNGQNFERYFYEHAVSKTLQDKQGFIWLATSQGVARWDGNKYDEFKGYFNKSGFRGSQVLDLHEDEYGRIWAASHDKGLSIFSKGNFVHYSTDSTPWKIPENTIVELEGDGQGNLWMNRGNNLYRVTNYELLDEAIVTKFAIQGIGPLSRIFISSSGKIYLLGNGLFELIVDGNEYTTREIFNDSVQLDQAAEDSDGNLYVSSKQKLFRIEEGEVNEVKLNHRFATIIDLYSDDKGKLWLSTNRGFLILDFNKDEIIQKVHFQNTLISHISQDQSGNFYISIWQNKFFKLGWNYDQYEHIELEGDFGKSYVYKFYEDYTGNYWLGTKAGLLRYNSDSKTFRDYRKIEGDNSKPPSNRIFAIEEDIDKNMWVGTDQGPVKYDSKKDQFITLDYKDYTGNRFSHNIMSDSKGDLWININGNLGHITRGKLEIDVHEFDGHRLQSFRLDNSDYIYGWCRNAELHKISTQGDKPEIIETYLKDQNITPASQWIVIDKLNRVWLSWVLGVVVFDPSTNEIIHYFNKENKLGQDDVYEMIPDNDGNIWLKQVQAGSVSINPETFEAISFAPHWLYRIGTQSYACVNAKVRDGKLFTDGDGSFFVFHPDSIRKNQVLPKIHLREQKINGVFVDTLEPKLSHDQNNLEITYAGLQFDNPLRNNYSYVLEGYDNAWNEVQNSRTARYSSLPPGNYTFKVKASNSDGLWSDEKVLAQFRILPPWYQSTIAYVVYGVLALLLLYFFYQIQLKRRLATQESLRLKEIDQFKNHFFTNITHEFRTPLTVILGSVEKIKSDTGIMIKRNGQQLLTLINQILELSKLESKSSRLKMQKGDILPFLRYLTSSFHSLAEEKGISIEFATDSDKITMDFDEEKVTMILNNLISNAIKFTGSDGSVTVVANKTGTDFSLQVQDTGKGIPEKDIENIFDRYYQVETDESQGTGIGLALTKELVKAFDGSIQVKSKVGEGTTFLLTWPITEVSVETYILSTEDTEPEVIVSTNGTIENEEDRLHVLLVEDNADVRTFVSEVLREEYKVTTAENGKIGIEKALELIPDLIISDVMMPEKNGLEVTQALKNDPITNHIPIILLTAKADIESRLSGLTYGADVYLAKPFNANELLLHLKNLLDLRQKLWKKYEQGFIPEVSKTAKVEDKFITDFYETLLSQLSDDSFGIEEICRELGVSRTQLHRKLKATTGKSTSIFIRDIRLEEAQKLLKTEDLNISEVAYSVGFSDPNYFSSLYSNKFGKTPTEELKSAKVN